MKARLIPVYFESGRDADFNRQVDQLKRLIADEAEVLEPTALGSPLVNADGVIFPPIAGRCIPAA